MSANDLTQQTESSGGAQPWTKKRRGGATSPPPGSRRASASLLCSLFPNSHGLLLWDRSLMQSGEATSAKRLVVLTESVLCRQSDALSFLIGSDTVT